MSKSQTQPQKHQQIHQHGVLSITCPNSKIQAQIPKKSQKKKLSSKKCIANTKKPQIEKIQTNKGSQKST